MNHKQFYDDKQGSEIKALKGPKICVENIIICSNKLENMQNYY